MTRNDVGILLNPDTLMQRKYFIEMTHLIGITVVYRAPKENSHYDGYGEFDTYFYPSEKVGCIFDEHPEQKTMRKLGWDSERDEGLSVINVPYDLKNLRVGALFVVPSGIDGATGRVFRVVNMSNIMLYPSSIACEIAPEYADKFDRSQLNHAGSDLNLLSNEEDDL